MELGWIDFSSTDRNIVMGVLDLLGEKGVLDELGIAPIRDYYSELFFPGTSTVQTRAKYFLIVPYIFKDLESSNQLDFFKLKKEFDSAEENCAHIFLDKNPKENGVIGKRAILNGRWVNRKPSSIYWAGLREYGIVKYKLSIDDCIRRIIAQKKNKKRANLGNNIDKGEGIEDDKFALGNNNFNLFNIPTYNQNWIDELDIHLTYDEGQFLKNQIITNCSESMFAYILKEDLYEVLDCKSFMDLQSIINKFPKNIQNDYFKALSFSEFVFALRVIYNVMISNENNQKANEWLNTLDLKEISNINLDEILSSGEIENKRLRRFLNESKDLMKNEDIEGLKECVKSQEIYLKNNRAKSLHVGEFDYNVWFGGDVLNYRFQNAKAIMQDIYDSENKSVEVIEDVESEQ